MCEKSLFLDNGIMAILFLLVTFSSAVLLSCIHLNEELQKMKYPELATII